MPVPLPFVVSAVPADPRSTITEESFRIAPELLGTPLARPWRRALAMAVDGLLIAILANAPSVLLALAAAFVLFRASASNAPQGVLRRSVRRLFRFVAAAVLFVATLKVWDQVGDMAGSVLGDEEAPAVHSTALVAPPVAGGESAPRPDVATGLKGMGLAVEVLALTRAESEVEARREAERAVSRMRELGVADHEVREVLAAISVAPGKPWLASVADSILRDLDAAGGRTTLSSDSLILASAAAISAGDSSRAGALRDALTLALAGDTLAELQAELQKATEDQVALERRLAESRRGRGLLPMLSSLADDLGLGFGWTGLYFTAFLALGKGYTPGKRLLRIRVIRLDGKPIGWWQAFERFGGYAASFATGLLGFVQVAWDRNRQAIHDKIAGTVVIEDA